MTKIPAFSQRLSSALDNPDISTGLADFQQRWLANRDDHIQTLERRTGATFDELAKQVAASKQHARQNPEILEDFIRNAQARGAHVLKAATAQDACQAIAKICHDHSAQLLVKTKSMATEEIFLNEHLESAGISVVETDLGEWLLQCMQDRPSHLIVPAIHKRRHDIAKLLEQIYGTAFNPDDIQKMARVVRTELRPHFMAAGVGLTGANILIADTGSVVLVTNEGNAGLTTALPPVQIVLAGWDKLTPTVESALQIVQLLAKSATGQVISSYTQFIHGPIAGSLNSQPAASHNSSDLPTAAGGSDLPTAAGGSDLPTAAGGKQELFIVLLDNGRSQIAADPKFESVLSCIRCGACSNVCPPYQVVGGHVFGHVYTGAIGLVTAGFHHGWDNAAGPQSLCVSCGACANVCPADIPLPKQILAVRAKLFPEKTSLPLRVGIRILSSRRLTAATVGLAKVLTAPFQSNGTLKRLPLPKKFRWRTPPAIPLKPARRLKELKAVAEKSNQRPRLPSNSVEAADKTTDGTATQTTDKATQTAIQTTKTTDKTTQTALFLQCISDRLAPSIPLASLQLLQSCGDDVVVPTSQHCCGLPAIDLGDLKTAKKMASSTLDALEGYGCVVTPAVSCAIAMKHDYQELFAGEPEQMRRVNDLADRVFDLVSHLNANLPTGKDAAASNKTQTKVAVHKFCQSNAESASNNTESASNNTKSPTSSNEPALSQLLEKSCGIKTVALQEGDVCCGFGGSTSLSNPEVSKAILDRKLKNIFKAEAEILVTDNPGCVIHIRGGAQARKSPVEVLHVAEFLSRELKLREQAS